MLDNQHTKKTNAKNRQAAQTKKNEVRVRKEWVRGDAP